jgi:uncharacterized protein
LVRDVNRGRISLWRNAMKKLVLSLCIVAGFFAAAFSEENAKVLLGKANAGDAAAQAEVGDMFAIGRGVDRDNHEAVKWFTKSAEQGNPKGEYYLGAMYELGRGGLTKDAPAAIKWYEAAAKQGYVDAQFDLARIYDMGKGVPKNPAMAAKYYQEAAAQDQPTAELRLAQMYEAGQGVDQDYALSMKWYLKVATNFDIAEYKIGYFYEQGYGVPKDRTQALSWYHKAAKRGSTPAIAAMKKLED